MRLFPCHRWLIAALAVTLLPVYSSSGQRYELVWSDEFDGPEIDRSAWHSWDGGAFNNELQCYTDNPENAFIEDGVLHLMARRETRTCRTYSGSQKTFEYTSARIESWPDHGAGLSGHAWRYGRFEYRAKLPKETQGLWPALWMMPAQPQYGSWPYSGEIDVMEYRSNIPDVVRGTIHFSARAYPGSGSANGDRRSSGDDYVLPEGAFSDEFHVFALEWDADGMRWFVDDTQFHEIARSEIEQTAEVYPFDQPFYFILNLAVGGNYLPNPDATTLLPQAMEVDYVRVYRDANQPPSVGLHLDDPLPARAHRTLTAESDDADGVVVRVDYYLDDVLLGSSTESPYSLVWTTPTDGCYELGVQAFDNDGGVSTLVTVPIVVGTGCEQGSFFGAPFQLPGLLPLSGYDRGGQGIAYSDTTPLENLGNADGNTERATEGVDLLPMEQGSDDAYVAFIEQDEWLAYTVEVTRTGLYDLTLQARSAVANARARLESNGEYLTRFSRISPTTDMEFVLKTQTGIALESGTQEIRLIAETDGLELFALRFSTQNDTFADHEQPESIALLSPCHPNPFSTSTQITYTLPRPGPASITVYDLLGRQVATLVDETLPVGQNRLTFQRGELASGAYLLVMEADGWRDTQLLQLVAR
jgi:beta-glucanase (GH16 family)